MVEDIYKLAEKKKFDNANQMNVLGMARQNAQLKFKPLPEGISGKTVVLNFRWFRKLHQKNQLNHLINSITLPQTWLRLTYRLVE